MSAFIEYQKQVLLQQQQESIVHSNRKDGIITNSNSNNNTKSTTCTGSNTNQSKKSINTYSNSSNNNNNNNKTKSRPTKGDRQSTVIYSNGKIRNSKSSISSVATASLSLSNGVQTENNIPVLDLHGFRLEKALRAVTDFLEENRRGGTQDSASANVNNKPNSEIDHLDQKQDQVDTIEQRWHGYDDSETDGIKKDSRTRQPYWDQQRSKNRHNPSNSYHYHRKQQQQQQQLHSKIAQGKQRRYCWCRIVTGTGSHSGMTGGPILRTAIESLLQRRLMQYSIENPGCFLVNANSGIRFTTVKATGVDTKLQIIDNTNAITTTSSGIGHLQSFAAAAAAKTSSTVGLNKSTTIASKKNLNNNTKTPIKYKKRNSVVYDDNYMDHIATLKIRSLKDIQYEEELTRKEEEEFDAICRLSMVEETKKKLQQDQEDKLFQQALQVSTEEVAVLVTNDEELHNDDDDDDNEEEELRKAIEESVRVQQHEELLLREEETEEEVMIRRAIEESERLLLEQQLRQEQVCECDDDEEELLIKEAIRLSQLDQTNDVIVADGSSKDFHQSNAYISMTIQNEEMDNFSSANVITSINGKADKVFDVPTNNNDDCDESVGGQSVHDSSSNNNYDESVSSYPILTNNNMTVAKTTVPAAAVVAKIDDSCCPSITATYDDESYSETKNTIGDDDDDDDYCCVIADDEKYYYNYDNYIHEKDKYWKQGSTIGNSRGDSFGGSTKCKVDVDGGDISNNSDTCTTTVYYYDEVQEKIIQDILQMMNNIQHQST